MASTYSTNLGIELIGTGEQDGTWGITTNTNLGTLIEQAISGYTTYACTGGTDTITIPNGASGTARNMFLELTGSGGGTLVVPANRKLYFIYNNSSGAITVKVSGQTGVSVPVGAKTILVSNGTDTVPAVNYVPSLTLGSALPIASGGTGQVIANNAFNALAPSQSGASGKYLKSNGTDASWDAIDITTGDISGILALANGGTGSSSASGARSNLGLGSMATQNATSVSITGGSISGITDLAILDGGTGASDAGTARSNLGVPSTTGSGASGTWGINITGSAASAASAVTATTATNATNSTYATYPASGGTFITAANIGSQSVTYASTAGNASTANLATYANYPNSGGSFITSSNIGVQSVNYATSAGSVAYTNVTGRPAAGWRQVYSAVVSYGITSSVTYTFDVVYSGGVAAREFLNPDSFSIITSLASYYTTSGAAAYTSTTTSKAFWVSDNSSNSRLTVTITRSGYPYPNTLNLTIYVLDTTAVVGLTKL